MVKEDDRGRRRMKFRLDPPFHASIARHVLYVVIGAGLSPHDLVQWYYREGGARRVAAIENQYFSHREKITAEEPTLGDRRSRDEPIELMFHGYPDDFRISARSREECVEELLILLAWVGGESPVATPSQSFSSTLADFRKAGDEVGDEAGETFKAKADFADQLQKLVKARYDARKPPGRPKLRHDPGHGNSGRFL